MVSGFNLQKYEIMSLPLYHVLKAQLHCKTQEVLVESTTSANKHLD